MNPQTLDKYILDNSSLYLDYGPLMEHDEIRLKELQEKRVLSELEELELQTLLELKESFL